MTSPTLAATAAVAPAPAASIAAGPPLAAGVLRACSHWRVRPPFAGDEPDFGGRVALMGRVLGAQLRTVVARTGLRPDCAIVVGTVLSGAVGGLREHCDRFYDEVERAGGLRPSGIATAYMCTGWGFAMRFFARHTRVRRLAVLMPDVDVHNFEWHLRHRVIGPAGFGFTTLLLDLPEAGSVPACSGPHANSAVNELLASIRERQSRGASDRTLLPFLTDTLGRMAERVLAPGSLGPNLNAELGHCFGADPWIGVCRTTAQPPQERRVVAGAIAYAGYYTWADIRVPADAELDFRSFDGDAGALRGLCADEAAATGGAA